MKKQSNRNGFMALAGMLNICLIFTLVLGIFSLNPKVIYAAGEKNLVAGEYYEAGHGFRPLLNGGAGSDYGVYIYKNSSYGIDIDESKDILNFSADYWYYENSDDTEAKQYPTSIWTWGQGNNYLYYITKERGYTYPNYYFMSNDHGYYNDYNHAYELIINNDNLNYRSCPVTLFFPRDDIGAPWGLKVVEGDGSQANPFRFDVVFSAPHNITVVQGSHGIISADASGARDDRAGAGETIVVNIDPDEGYALDNLTYLAQGGSAVNITADENGVYKFEMPDKAVTITATFTAGHKVTFVPNNGSDNIIRSVPDADRLQPIKELEKTGKHFVGWFTEPNYNPSSYVDFENDPPTVTSDMILYARWANNLEPAWTDGDGKKGTWTKPDTIEDAGTITAYLYSVDEDDNEESVWSSEVGSTAQAYDFADAIDQLVRTSTNRKFRIVIETNLDNDGRYPVYSRSQANEFYKVTFDYQDGVTAATDMVVVRKEAYNKYGMFPALTTKPGDATYTFAGWYTKADGKGYLVRDKETFYNEEDQTLYAYWTQGHEHDEYAVSGWTATDFLPSSGNYYLTDDVEITSTWIPTGDVRLCLNGQSITYTGIGAVPVVRIVNDVGLYIYDCRDEQGSITGGKQGGIVISNGTLTLYGGKISHNSGSGVYLDGSGATFTLNGGSVSDNSAENGGGIYVDSGLLALLEGNVMNNTASGKGGGVYVKSGNAFFLKTEIKGNSAAKGGGVYINDRDSLLVSATPVIIGNNDNDGSSNLYLGKTNGEQKTIGGLLGGVNLQEGASIGVRMDDPGVFTDGNISNYIRYFSSDDPLYSVGITDENKGILERNSIVPVTGITVDPIRLELNEGDIGQLTATVSPDSATNKNVSWRSGDEDVATVDQSGKVTAVKEGTVIIEVTTEDGGKYALCDVVVRHIHDWDAPTYTWTDDNNSVTAKRICKSDDTHTEEEIVNSTSFVSKAATCEEKGKTTYTVTFTNAAFVTQTKTVEDIDATGHDWDEGTVTTEPECTKRGVKTFICKNDETHTKTEEVSSLGHNWGNWEEKSDDTGHYKTRKCIRCDETQRIEISDDDCEHNELTTIAKTEPTCTEDGHEVYYKCNFCKSYIVIEEDNRIALTEDNLDEYMEKLTIPALGHDWGEWMVTKEATETEEGIETRICKHDETHTEIRPIPKQKTYSISLNVYSVTWSEEEGYKGGNEEGLEADAVQKEIVATSTGSGEVTFIKAGFKEASSYEQFGLNVEGMIATVYPREGLKSGTYTATVVIGDFDERFQDIEVPVTFTVTAKKEEPKEEDIHYFNTQGSNQIWTKGNDVTADFTFKRSADDSVTFSHFTGIRVDGQAVSSSSYTAVAGSVVIRLKPAYLETLSVGDHSITALFDDGNASDVRFRIDAKIEAEVPFAFPRTGIE